VITWVGAHEAIAAEVRLYDRLFTEAHPDADGRNFLEFINPHSLRVVHALVEPSLKNVAAGTHIQFERHGYFVADRCDHDAPARLVFNKTTGLRESFAS
jgi:glutaminyl-tRNA synthetase